MSLDLVIRVRAVGDASLTSVFRSLPEASAKAQRTVESQWKKTGQAAVGAAKEGEAAARQAGDTQAKLIRDTQALRDKDHARVLGNIKEVEREQKKANAAVASEKKKTADRNERVGSAATRTFGGLVRAGVGLAGSVAQGMGIDMSVSGGIGKAVSRDAMARNIAAQGYRDRPGEQMQDIGALQSSADAIGDKYKMDPSKVLAGLGRYQALTGDLDTAKASLDPLAKLAKAFRVDMDQMMAAAGQVGSAMGEVGAGKEFATAEEKAAALVGVMKQATAQGQEGAIEIADLASQYAKLKGAGVRFEGGTGVNISKMSALAQLAYQTGGAGSVSQASNAVLGLTNTFSTAARRAAFKKHGVSLDSEKEAGKFKNPYDIIKEALVKTGGKTDPMKEMFGNILGEKAVNSLRTAFLNAGGGKQGLAAVDATFARFGGTVGDKQLNKAFDMQMGSDESDAQGAQNKINKAYAEMLSDLKPSINDLGNVAAFAAKSIAGLASYGAEHPVSLIMAAIAASIAKAQLGESVGKALSGALGGKAGIVIASAAITIMAIDKIFDAKGGADTRHVGLDNSMANAESLARHARQMGVVPPEMAKELDKEIATQEARVQAAKAAELDARTGINPELQAGLNFIRGGPDLQSIYTAREDMGQLPDLEKKLAGLKADRAAIQDTKVSNATEIGAAVAAAIAPMINQGGGAAAPVAQAGSGGVP